MLPPLQVFTLKMLVNDDYFQEDEEGMVFAEAINRYMPNDVRRGIGEAPQALR